VTSTGYSALWDVMVYRIQCIVGCYGVQDTVHCGMLWCIGYSALWDVMVYRIQCIVGCYSVQDTVNCGMLCNQLQMYYQFLYWEVLPADTMLPEILTCDFTCVDPFIASACRARA